MKNNIIILFLFSQILAQQDNWTLKSIQSNCPDIGTDEVCEGTPFSEFTIRGSEGDEEDDERWWWVSDSTLGLSNYDKGSNKSGSFKIVVRNDEEIVLNNATFVNRRYTIKIKFQFETKGDRDFLDDIFPQISEDKDGILEVGDDYFVAQLNGGDELSVDIDDEWSGIPSFRLKSQGKIIVESDAKDGSIDDESFLTLLSVSKESKETEGIPNNISLDDLHIKLDEFEKKWQSEYAKGKVGRRGHERNVIAEYALSYFKTTNTTVDGYWESIERARKGSGRNYGVIPTGQEDFSKEELLKYIALRKLVVDVTAKIELVEKAIEKKALKIELVEKAIEKKALELAFKNEADFIATFISTIIEKEKLLKQDTSKFYPIYLYQIQSGEQHEWLYSRVNIPIPDEIRSIKNNGYQFYVLNKPGIPIYRTKLDQNNFYISYSKQGSDEEKIFDLTLKDELKTKYGMYKDISLLPMRIDGEYIRESTNGSVFSNLVTVSKFIEFKESAIKRRWLENKPIYFLENLDRLKILGDNSNMIKKELRKIENEIKEKIQIPYFEILVKEAQEARPAIYENKQISNYYFPNTKQKDKYLSHLLSMNNPTIAEAELIKRQYQVADFERVLISPKRERTERTETRINQIIYHWKSLFTIKPKWMDVVEFYGGYSELANKNINKKNYEDGWYSAEVKLYSFELLNSNECLAIVHFSGAIELNNMPKDHKGYKGTYKIEDYDLVDIYQKNLPKMIFSFENKKYLGSSNEFSIPINSVGIKTRPSGEETIKNSVFSYISVIDMMFDDAISDEEFGKIITKYLGK